MEQQRTCKLCSKSFSSFPALCGHMRRHSATSTCPAISSVSKPLKKSRHCSPLEAASSVSDAAMTAAEEAANTLVFLSRNGEIKSVAVATVKRRRSTPALSDAARCPDCKREFISHQALGGHRKGLKTGKVSCVTAVSNADANANLRHKCGICRREFGSAQALGGHKRAHMYSYSSAGMVTSSSLASP